jgi:F0F1-type ATP synthase membrane subunit a
MLFLSPFEDSAIFSYFWLLSQASCNNFFVLFFSNLNGLYNFEYDSYYVEYYATFSFLFFDAVDFVYSSFFMFVDSNYTFVLFIICLFFSLFCFKRSIRRISQLSSVIFNSIADFIYNSMVLSYLGLDGRRYFSFFLFLFYFILFGNLLGLVPSFFPLTSNLSVTLFLSSIC